MFREAAVALDGLRRQFLKPNHIPIRMHTRGAQRTNGRLEDNGGMKRVHRNFHRLPDVNVLGPGPQEAQIWPF